jgi:hypothetical protein
LTFEEYLARFRLLRHALEKDERALLMISGAPYRDFERLFSSSRDPALARMVLTEPKLRERIEKRRRLCERYAARLARGVEKIGVEELREYARLHYLYGLTHEMIAEQSFFSVRTVYRHGKKAKEAMEKALLEVSPKIRRIPSGRFGVKGPLRMKDYRVDRVSHSVATLNARKNSAPYRPLLCY